MIERGKYMEQSYSINCSKLSQSKDLLSRSMDRTLPVPPKPLTLFPILMASFLYKVKLFSDFYVTVSIVNKWIKISMCGYSSLTQSAHQVF